MRSPSRERVGWAVVGLGPWTLKQILETFQNTRLARPAALVSSDRAYARRLGRRHGIPPDAVYDGVSFDRISENPDVEAVYLVLPDGMHTDFTIRAARARKHVLCETPLSRRREDVSKMIGECRRASVRFAMRDPAALTGVSGATAPFTVEIDRFSRSLLASEARILPMRAAARRQALTM